MPQESEILVIDDNSPDGTAKIVESLIPKYPRRLHILNRAEKQGLARAYIAADAAAHPDRKAVMFENAPQNAAYYGFEVLPAYSAEEPYDVLYGLNDIFHLHEMEMYENMARKNIESDNMLKIFFYYDPPTGDGGMIFKKQR
jgi:glycosyltransferase involved in cell wall biosynthesis